MAGLSRTAGAKSMSRISAGIVSVPQPAKPVAPKRPSRFSKAEEAPAACHDCDHAEALAALEEYRRTGVSYSVDQAVAELDRLIAERRARKA